jgi:hypothetical protein
LEPALFLSLFELQRDPIGHVASCQWSSAVCGDQIDVVYIVKVSSGKSIFLVAAQWPRGHKKAGLFLALREDKSYGKARLPKQVPL